MAFSAVLFRTALEEICAANQLDHYLAEPMGTRLVQLAARLCAENAHYNLTAITEERAMALRHMADSLLCARYLPQGCTLLDVGCGAGFPSLPLAICRPDLRITAMDATAKRVQFVTACAEELELDNLVAVCCRAEEGAHTPLRESFDVVTARAVAALPTLSELCLPYVRVGGMFLSMKARGAEEELAAARAGIGMLGGQLERCETAHLCDGAEDLTRTALLFRKKGPTPASYPRPYARILKKPLSGRP